jgi:hypothetical protein
MFWIVQNNLYNERGYTELVDTLIRFDIPYVSVKPVPIINKLLPSDFDSHSFYGDISEVPEPLIPTNSNVMVCGAVTLSKIAKQRGWTPGSFLNDDFTFESWRKHYGCELLNHDSKICEFKDVTNYWPTFFIRPCLDSKVFTGCVYNWDTFYTWQRDILALNDELCPVKSDTLVSYCSVKEILREYRFFVVDGRIVTGSQYKLGDRVFYSADIDSDVISYAEKMIAIWQPARAFVIDIALVRGGEFKIVEINNINSAGFYACDIQKFVFAIENMAF